MKKIVYRILFVILFIIAIFNITSFAASDFSYTIDEKGNATITAYNGTESNLVIPSTIDGYNVVTIGAHAFNESRNSTNGKIIKNLVISEGIERIELLAFAKCENLETVKLPESLTFLDMQVFLQCSKLKTINIPSKIKNIGNSTFQETGFTEFIIPENVKSIHSRALGICPNLEKVTVYSKDIKYEDGVFEYGSSNLELCAYSGSTTQIYAHENGINFKTLALTEDDEDILIKIGSFRLNKNELELKENESETLTVTLLEISLDTQVIWSSSDERVAVVENGKVIAKNIGNTIITASTEDGEYQDTCIVSVIEEAPKEEVPKEEAPKEDIEKKDDNEDSHEQTEKTDKEDTKGDNTQATGKLPQTGVSTTIFFIILIIIIINVFMYKKNCKLKDIK